MGLKPKINKQAQSQAERLVSISSNESCRESEKKTITKVPKKKKTKEER